MTLGTLWVSVFGTAVFDKMVSNSDTDEGGRRLLWSDRERASITIIRKVMCTISYLSNIGGDFQRPLGGMV